jgi:hypothetical protein
MFLFPFTTCENVNRNGIAQPYSAIINIITFFTLVLLTFVAKTLPVKLMLSVYAAFEAWHAFSHMKHIPGVLQTNVVHVLGYMMAFATLNAILYLSNSRPSIALMGIISFAVIVDIYVFYFVKGVYTVFTGLLIFAAVVLGSYSKIPHVLKIYIPYLIIGLIALFGLFINETYNCEKMLRYRLYPYHAAIEILGFVLFTALAMFFLQWEKIQ